MSAPTEAQEELLAHIIKTAAATWPHCREALERLIANSEAKAVEVAHAERQIALQSEAQLKRELRDNEVERDQLRAEVEKLTECNRISVQSSIAIAKQRDEAEASLSEMIKQSRIDSSVAGIAICNEMGAIARAERAESALCLLVGKVESVICDTEGAVAHIFEREPGDKYRVQVALDRARQVCATIPIKEASK